MANYNVYPAFAIGTNGRVHQENAIALGYGATVTTSQSIAIGHTSRDEVEPENCIIIGHNIKAKGPNEVRLGSPGQTVYLAGENIFERIEKLEELVQAQTELINSLWYHPGNPGALEAEERYRRHSVAVKLEDDCSDPEDDDSDVEDLNNEPRK